MIFPVSTVSPISEIYGKYIQCIKHNQYELYVQRVKHFNNVRLLGAVGICRWESVSDRVEDVLLFHNGTIQLIETFIRRRMLRLDLKS